MFGFNFFGGEKREEPQPDSYKHQAVPKSGSESLGSDYYDNNVDIKQQLETKRRELAELGEKDDTWSNQDRAEITKIIEELENQLRNENKEAMPEKQEEVMQ